MPNNPPNLNSLWAQLLAGELVRCGVQRFVVSPGSRSAPLTVAAAQHPDAAVTVHYDERGAAFYALGCALGARAPVALVCTSGTAAANYLPAVVEAAQSYIPLLVLTADRPPELQDAGANQAIRQGWLYGDYVRWSHSLPCPDRAIAPEVALTAAAQAVYRATRAPAGPVHLNCPFREPLAPTPADDIPDGYTRSIAGWLSGTGPYTTYYPGGHALPLSPVTPVAAALDAGTRPKRPLLILGRLDAPEDREAAGALARRLGWPTVPDIGSGWRLRSAGAPFLPYCGQLLLCESARERLAPDLVLHLGGPVVSKRLLEFLSARRPGAYLHAAASPHRLDPAHLVTHRFDMPVAAFCEQFAGDFHWDTAWAAEVFALHERMQRGLEAALSKLDGCCEPRVARLASQEIPHGSVLFLGNSMPIRDMDLYGDPGGGCADVFANRGASGIDGNLATAAGLAAGTGRPVCALIGDLAALHDLNSLALVARATPPVTLVVLNNNGGAIFSFLPIAAAADVFEPYFAAPHGYRFEGAARMFGLTYTAPASPDELAAALAENNPGPRLIELRTDRANNLKVHRALEAAVRGAAGA